MLNVFLDVLKSLPDSKKFFVTSRYYDEKANACCAIGASNLDKSFKIGEFRWDDELEYGDPNSHDLNRELYDYFKLESLGVTLREAIWVQERNDEYESKTKKAYFERNRTYIGFRAELENEQDLKDRYNYVISKIEDCIKESDLLMSI